MRKEIEKNRRSGRNGIAFMVAGIVVALLLSGCRQVNSVMISDEPVHIDWRETIAAMGYVTMYPPQEDVRVGDLLLCNMKSAAMTGDGPKYMLSVARWSMVDVGSLLEAEYTQRGEMPETPHMYYQVEKDPSSRQWLEATAPEGQSLFAGGTPPNRLRSVAAGLIAASWDQAGNNVLVPTEAINMAMGTSWADEKTVNFRVAGAEEYSLSFDKIIPAALEKRGEGAESGYFLKDAYLSNLALMTPAGSNSVYLVLVNEVLYLRSLDISVQSQQASRRDQRDQDVSAGAMSVSVETTSTASAPPASAPAPQAATADPNDPNAAPVAPAPAPATPAASESHKKVELGGRGQPIDPGLVSYVRAQALNKSIMGADYDDLPGEFVRFISVSDESVALRKVWRRGLGIGIKGLVLGLDKHTGEVLSTELMVDFFQ